MTSDGGSHNVNDQPGLEVNYQPGLEVDHRYTPASDAEGLQPVPYQDEPKPYNQNAAAVLVPGTYYGGQDTTSPGAHTAALSNYDGQTYNTGPPAEATTKSTGNKKALWIAIGVLVVLVIVGAVLGGVLGSRAAKSSSSDGSDPTSSGNSTSNSTTLTNIRSMSRLSVTGWRDGSNYRIRLFYQGQDQKLRMSTYASNESSWSDPIALTGLEYAAADNTALAASTTVENSPVSFTHVHIMSGRRGAG